MKAWSITEARAKISDVFDAALTAGPQRIERRDSESVVMVAASDWNRLIGAYGTMSELVLEAPLEPEDRPPRRAARVLDRSED